jgi:hypothetical protein
MAPHSTLTYLCPVITQFCALFLPSRALIFPQVFLPDSSSYYSCRFACRVDPPGFHKSNAVFRKEDITEFSIINLFPLAVSVLAFFSIPFLKIPSI